MLSVRLLSAACLSLSPLVISLPAWADAVQPPGSTATVDAGAAIVTELDETEVQLAADGTYSRRIHKRFRILNERGQKLYSDAQFGYRPDDETVTIDEAFTLGADGQRHPL